MILTVRGQKVILDRDLAALYGVPTFRFNEAVKRNRRCFPDDFMFQFTRQEMTDLISQNAISSSEHGGLGKLLWAFPEHGAVMAAKHLARRAGDSNERLYGKENRADFEFVVFFVKGRHFFLPESDIPESEI
jgi:hypothetical protein